MLGVDHDKNILLSTPFPTIPMLGRNCWCNVIVFYVGNKRCIVLYCVFRCISVFQVYFGVYTDPFPVLLLKVRNIMNAFTFDQFCCDF